MAHKITELKAQQRNPNRISVYLDGEYAFGLSRIVAAWLQVGQTISDEKISALRAEETREAAFQQALRLLSYRPRSEAEIRKKLADKGFDVKISEYVIQRLIEEKYLGDQTFAQTWVENRSNFRPRSRRLLKYELRQKGVAEEYIESALASVNAEPDLAYQAGIRYATRLADLDWETFRKRLGAYLGRRGFSYGTIAPVVSQIWNETHSSDRTS
jgi:regulatory protein